MLNAENVDELSELDAPVLTAYLNIQPPEPARHRLTPLTYSWLRKQGKMLLEKVNPRVQPDVRGQLARIEQFLHKQKPSEKALLILAGPRIWGAISLPVAVQNELVWGRPALTQLRMALDRARTDYIVVLDRKRARVFQCARNEMTALFDQSFSIDSSHWKRKTSGHVTVERTETMRGSQRDAYEDRIDAQYNRFLRQVAKKCGALCAVPNDSMLFIVGDPRLAKAIESKLPPLLRVRAQHIPCDAARLPWPRLQTRLKQEVARLRQKHETDLVGKALDDAQHVVVGIDETVAQIQKGRVGTLLLSDHLNGEIRECPECGLMDRSADPVCPVCRRERRPVDLREAVLDMARSNKTNVRVISGEASNRLEQAGGMAGWLRGRTQSELR